MEKRKFQLIRLQRCLSIMCPIATLDMLRLILHIHVFVWSPKILRLKGHKSLTAMPCRTTTGTTASLSMEMRKSSCALWIMTLRMANSHMQLAEPQVRIDIIVIIHIRSYLSTAMDRTWQSAEYDKWFVPYHQELEVLRILPTGFDPAMSRTISGIETGRSCAMAR